MKDRVSADPGRVLVVPEGEEMQSYYATLYRADNPTQEGTPLNKATFLKDATAALYGLTGDAVPDEVLAAVPLNINAGWKLLESFTEAGSGNWTVPDLFGGKGYLIGVAIIGGGGGGGAAGYWLSTSNTHTASATATGGASGLAVYLTKKVSPGDSYAYVVGAGGDGGEASPNSTEGNGTDGNSSSFGGISAGGGEGGRGYGREDDGYSSDIDGASGGQGSDWCRPWTDSSRFNNESDASIPYGGRTLGIYQTSGTEYETGLTYPAMCINPFTNSFQLFAGGLAEVYGYSTSISFSVAQTNGSRTSGSSGAVGSLNSSATASKSSAPGAGGGAAVIAGSDYSSTRRAHGADGADGAVLIYVQGGVVE